MSRIDSDSDSYESEEDTEQSQETSSEIKRKRIRYNVQIARQTIRKLFIDNISPSNILWNKSLDSYEWMPRVEGSDVNSYGNMKVKFKDNSEYNISMLVAADGIYSPVRKILEPANSAHQLQYLGLMVILGISSVSSKALSELVGCSGDKYRQMQWVDGKSRIFSMPYNSNKTMWQFSYPLSEEDANILSTSRLTSDGRGLTVEDQGKILLDAALQQCKGWCPAVQKLVTETDCSLISGHPVYDRDPITPEALQEWKEMFQSSVNNKKRKLDEQFVNQDKFIPMTFIGDAVHPMSPFKGQGANQALLDAFSLTKAILNSEFCGEGRRPVAEAILDYERQMCTRSKEKVLKSREAAKSLHSPAALVEADMTRASAATQVAE